MYTGIVQNRKFSLLTQGNIFPKCQHQSEKFKTKLESLIVQRDSSHLRNLEKRKLQTQRLLIEMYFTQRKSKLFDCSMTLIVNNLGF